ncbi:hypothetical protein ATANTOWER_002614 [Ataeniobius toweri]|uniref:Uncharacterized protein n=1 Tax=Ataeniobius toweri TaxID=208326 RepID=A0ABU7C8I9_9TELE|nr:hypothetical protein [Ataeniobius toweri]
MKRKEDITSCFAAVNKELRREREDEDHEGAEEQDEREKEEFLERRPRLRDQKQRLSTLRVKRNMQLCEKVFPDFIFFFLHVCHTQCFRSSDIFKIVVKVNTSKRLTASYHKCLIAVVAKGGSTSH